MGAREEKLEILGWICRLVLVSLQVPPLELMLCCICVVVKARSLNVFFCQGVGPE